VVLEEEVVARFDVLSRNIPEMFKGIQKRAYQRGPMPQPRLERFIRPHNQDPKAENKKLKMILQ
jgi:hypothetical protein